MANYNAKLYRLEVPAGTHIYHIGIRNTSEIMYYPRRSIGEEFHMNICKSSEYPTLLYNYGGMPPHMIENRYYWPSDDFRSYYSQSSTDKDIWKTITLTGPEDYLIEITTELPDISMDYTAWFSPNSAMVDPGLIEVVDDITSLYVPAHVNGCVVCQVKDDPVWQDQCYGSRVTSSRYPVRVVQWTPPATIIAQVTPICATYFNGMGSYVSDGYMYCYTSTGTFVFSDDDDGGGNYARHYMTFTGGITYNFECTHYNSNVESYYAFWLKTF